MGCEHISVALQGCGVTEQKSTNNLPNPISHSVNYFPDYSFRRKSFLMRNCMNHDRVVSGDLDKQADLPPFGVV